VIRFALQVDRIATQFGELLAKVHDAAEVVDADRGLLTGSGTRLELPERTDREQYGSEGWGFEFLRVHQR